LDAMLCSLLVALSVHAVASDGEATIVYRPCSEFDLYDGWTRDIFTERGRVAERPPPQLRGCSQIIVTGAELSSSDALALAQGIASDGAACNSTEACVRQLDAIALDGVPVGDVGTITLAGALRAGDGPLPFNVSVALGSAGVGAYGATALAEALRQPTTTVRTLTLEWNDQLGDEGAAALGNALRHNSALRSLGLERCGVGDVGAAALGVALRDNPASQLHELRLEGNRIGVDGAAHLAAALSTVPREGELTGAATRLRTLGLALNPLDAAGAALLARGLQRNDGLESLDLAGCNIGDEGAVALATALRGNTALRNLNLLSNGIGAVGARALASMLRINPALRTLNLRLNAIGANAAAALVDAVQNGEAATRGAGQLETLLLEHNLVLNALATPAAVAGSAANAEPPGSLPPSVLAQAGSGDSSSASPPAEAGATPPPPMPPAEATSAAAEAGY